MYTPLYRKPFIILKKVYARHEAAGPKMPDLNPPRVYAFLKYLLPFSKIAYTRQAPMMPDSSPSLVYATVQKPLHHLETKRMHAMRLQASKYLFSVLYAYTLL